MRITFWDGQHKRRHYHFLLELPEAARFMIIATAMHNAGATRSPLLKGYKLIGAKCRDTWDALMSPAAVTTAKLCISQNYRRQSKKQPSLRHVLDVCTVLHSFGALGTHTHNNSRLSFHLIQGIVWEFANSPPTPASISIFSGDLRARTLRILAGLCMAPKLSDDDT